MLDNYFDNLIDGIRVWRKYADRWLTTVSIAHAWWTVD